MTMAIATIIANPCQRLADLQTLKDAIITGGQVLEVETQAGSGARRRVKYGPGSIAALDVEIVRAQIACDALNKVVSPRRFAVGGRLD